MSILNYKFFVTFIRRLLSVSFFSALGFRLFSVNPGCTALAFEPKIYKKQKEGVHSGRNTAEDAL